MRFANRESRALLFLVVASACFVGTLLITYVSDVAAGPAVRLPQALLEMSGFLMFLTAPFAAGVFAAIWWKSHRSGVRVLVGLLTAVVVFVVLFILRINIYIANGGKTFGM